MIIDDNHLKSFLVKASALEHRLHGEETDRLVSRTSVGSQNTVERQRMTNGCFVSIQSQHWLPVTSCDLQCDQREAYSLVANLCAFLVVRLVSFDLRMAVRHLLLFMVIFFLLCWLNVEPNKIICSSAPFRFLRRSVAHCCSLINHFINHIPDLYPVATSFTNGFNEWLPNDFTNALIEWTVRLTIEHIKLILSTQSGL